MRVFKSCFGEGVRDGTYSHVEKTYNIVVLLTGVAKPQHHVYDRGETNTVSRKQSPSKESRGVQGGVYLLSTTHRWLGNGMKRSWLQFGAFRVKPRAVARRGSDLPRLHL